MTSDRITTYVGAYTRREPAAGGTADGIGIYDLDPISGQLAYVSTVTGAGTLNPSYLTAGPDGKVLYAVNEIAGDAGPYGTVSAFAIDPATHNLSYLNQQSTHGLAPCHVSIEPEGNYCLVANYESGDICVLPIREDGSLGEATDVVQFSGSGADPARQAGPHAHMILTGPDREFVLAVDLGTDRLMAFRLDKTQGALSPADPPWTQMSPGVGPRHLAFHPHRPFAYVIGELDSTVTVMGYAQGTFTALQTLSTLPDDYTAPNTGAAIRVAPSGRFVYASNRGHDSLAIYAVNPDSGLLSLVGHEPTQGVGPRDFVIDPSGALLLAANQNTDTVVTFRVDPDAGTLDATGHVATAPTPVCLYLYGR